MKYLLDTDTLIDYVKDRGNARGHINALIEADEEVALCAITVTEIYSGLSDKKRKVWDSWLLALSFWHIGFDVAVRPARIGRRPLKQDARYRQQTRCLLLLPEIRAQCS